MHGLVLQVDGLLRSPSGKPEEASGKRLRDWASILIGAGLAYGAVMGCFGGIQGDRLLQVLYSALKVPLLLVVTFAVSLPSFFVLNTILGLREDFPRVLSALVATQTALTVVLLSLAPFTAFWYASSSDYEQALLFNGVMFAVASVTAQWILRRRYEALIAAKPRHRALLRAWLGIYIFVGIQMAWVLRPFVGSPGLPVQFFRSEAWGNAYEVVVRMVWKVILNP